MPTAREYLRRSSSKLRWPHSCRRIIRSGWKRRSAVVWNRLTRHVERLERHITISNEALALFVRFWLTATPPLPDTAQPAAQTKGRERYEGFVEALGRRLARGQTLAQEISLDIDPAQTSPTVPRE
jgi:hypothetical protein